MILLYCSGFFLVFDFVSCPTFSTIALDCGSGFSDLKVRMTLYC